MKILVCTDGSEESKKAMEKASMIAGGCQVDDVAVLYVYEDRLEIGGLPLGAESSFSKADMERFMKLRKENRENAKNLLAVAVKYLQDQGIQARSIFKEGHPAHTIVTVAEEEGFDMIIMGSRGLGGLKKAFLGSVSNAVLQEVKDSSVLAVK